MDYNAGGGKVTVNGSDTSWVDRIVTDSNGWYTNPNQIGDYAHPGTFPPTLLSTTVTSAGSPKIRLRWTGSGTPPPDAWVLVDSMASWSSTSGNGGGANNGYPNDPLTDISFGKQRTGKHVVRLTGGTERIYTLTVSATATATSLATDTQGQTASAQILIVGAATDKNASLTRNDGGGYDTSLSKDDVYVAHTLLSWDADTRPGLPPNDTPDPTYQSLTGTYGGTWNTKSISGPNNSTLTVDDTSVKWNGATPAGILSLSPTPTTPSIRATVYPSSPTGGKMPTADLSSCSSQTQTWSYEITDNGDGTKLNLKCNWIAHFAYENYRPFEPGAPSAVTFFDGPIVMLTNETPSLASVVPADSYTCRTGFEPSGDVNSEVPGFPVLLKHIGIQELQNHYADTKLVSWPATSVICTKYPTEVSPTYYKGRLYVNQQSYDGLVDAWNRKGQRVDQALRYWLGNSGSYSTRSVWVDMDGGV